MESNHKQDSHSGKSQTSPKAGNDASKTLQDTDTALKRFKKVVEGDKLSSRAYKKLVLDAIVIIEGLINAKFHFETTNSNDNPSIAKILQEIQIIKASISQSKAPTPTQGHFWEKIAGKPEVGSTTIRIQDDEESKEIPRLWSKELVKKIGINEAIAARQISN